MDATEDRDLKLQRASGDLIGELTASLPALLRHPHTQHGNDRGTVRKFVWWTTLRDLVKLLEPFQEWPQLLDPHLSSLLPPLIDAFLDFVSKYHLERPSHVLGEQVLPLSGAICTILYTFCKIRGVKVISSFFSNEPRWIESILSALQNWDKLGLDLDKGLQPSQGLIWEEKYVVLTWLSHLMLTPFDLASISSGKVVGSYNSSQSFRGPPNVPALAHNVVAISTSHLASAGKERDAAATLLVRLALRPDMQRNGMLESLVQWVLASLASSESDSASLYESLAHLSMLAKICSSADAAVVEPHLMPIFECVQAIASAQSSSSGVLYSSALTRKSIIKIVRSISVVALQLGHKPGAAALSTVADEIVEQVIELLLVACGDKETPVRLAASKAIGIISLKLEPELATQVVQAVIQGLEENVFWEESILDQLIESGPNLPTSERQLRSRNLNAVDAPTWQGLTLSLSNLLFRRCPPPSLLPEILNALLLALTFEQRSPTGISMGSNVRDAACYGIWSLARRYTTAELLSVDTLSIQAIADSLGPLSILQILANELVVTSSIDPSGNIRRGASAALQEMVGRHPDCIANGIALIQVVDYNAVALRSRALTEVVPQAAKLHRVYWEILFDGLLGWRGLGSPDATTRRLAARSFGMLSAAQGLDIFFMALARIRHRILRIGSRNVEKRHGLSLALVASLERFDSFAGLEMRVQGTGSISTLWDTLAPGSGLDEESFSGKASHPQLTAEAACLLIHALSRNLQKNSLGGTSYGTLPAAVLENCMTAITLSFERREQLVTDGAIGALQELFPLLEEQDRRQLIARFLSYVDPKRTVSNKGAGTKRDGYLAGLGAVFDQIEEDDPARESILSISISHLQPENSIETRVAALASLRHGILQSTTMPMPLVHAFKSCLEDYTTDQRGDVGSLVRIEAIDMVLLAWQSGTLNMNMGQEIYAKVIGLAAAKLNKVRLRAWRCLCGIFDCGGELRDLILGMHFSAGLDVSSQQYFQQLLSFSKLGWAREPLLEGLITSAGTGSESVLNAARSALVAHLQSLDDNGLGDFFQAFNKVLETSLTKERLAISVLEVLAFILDTRILPRWQDSTFNSKKTLFLVQKSHYKSTSIPKLKAAIEAYLGLCSLPAVRHQASAKLRTMLLHPYPQIRNAAADALFSITQEELILRTHWARSPKDLKSIVAKLGTVT